MKKVLSIEIPNDFNFRNTVYSHGWSELLPFELDKETWRLRYVFFEPSNETSVSASIYQDGEKLIVEIDGNDADADFDRKIISDIRHILSLDEVLSNFYELIGGNQDLSWICEANAGRLIRSPTVFEDLVKTICTTNCSWGLTQSMTANLVENLGVAAADGRKAFPTAKAMAEQTDEFYRKEIRAGYRSGYFVELAESVASGKIDPESWRDSKLPTSELKKEMKRIKGVGNYAAENLLKLVGRFDGLALDSFLRSEFYKKYNAGIECPDNVIESFYQQFGDYRGLAIWFDMTKRWFD